MLVIRPQRMPTRDQRLDLTRGRAAVSSDRSMDIQISRIRSKLAGNPKEPSMIKTVWGGGYLFVPGVIDE